jgi:hypothetical protein
VLIKCKSDAYDKIEKTVFPLLPEEGTKGRRERVP